MSEYNKSINEFLQKTCAQIRYKSVHKSITNELSDHIEEQKLEYIKQGLDEEAATEKALEQMGDPVLVGKQLDKAHQPKTEWSIISLAAILVVIGGIVQFFISKVNTYPIDIFSNFLIYASIGIMALAITYFFDYTLIGRYPRLIYFILFAVTLAGFLIFSTRNGAYTHVYYAALLFMPVYAGIIYGFRDKDYWGILACGLFYLPVAFVCIIAPRLNALILLSIGCLIMLTIAITKGFFSCNKRVGLLLVYTPSAFIVLLQFLFLFSNPYRRDRLSVMFNPTLDPLGSGYQHILVKRLIAASQPFGNAVLNGDFANMPIERILPGWISDFSLTYIIAKFGYVTGIAIALTLFILIVRMFISVIKQKNRLGFLLSLAACISISGQFILYLLSNAGILVAFSGTLPFISFGGMGFVTNMILVGIVLSVHRRTNIAIDRQQNNYHGNQLITFEDGKLIINFGSKPSKNTD